MLQQLVRHKNYLTKLTCLFWFIAKITSYKLWIADRFFPVIPPFNFLLVVPNVVHVFLLLASLVMLLYIVFRHVNKNLFLVLFSVEILSCLLDQNRWQPWQYQYLITILIFYFNNNEPQKLNTWLSIILATTYFYSGLQKFNQGFVLLVWQKAFLHDFFNMPTHIAHHKIVTNAGFVLAILETLIGMGIVFLPTRKVALMLAFFMHCFILVIIGPWGLNINIIVWHWNVIMMLYIVYLLYNKQYAVVNYKALHGKYNFSMLTIWCLFPLLNFIGYWDNFLSFSLYSGRIPNMEICVQENLPKELEPYFHLKKNPIKCNGKTGVNIQVWGMNEIIIPPYPEVRVYKKIKLALQKKYPLMKAAYYVYWLPKSEENYIELK